MDRLPSNPAGKNGLKPTPEHRLTNRELEILQLIVDGKSGKEIAAHLGLSAKTVAAHRGRIMTTLKIHKAAKLVVYAIRNGLASIL
jgi:DNA-binding NarL/FixJ family response regulator